MKKFLCSLAVAALVSGTAYAQLPAGSTAPDFTITDIDGNEHNLYSILDEGKPVLLDLFATWCGPCWSFAETGVFEVFNAAYGEEGANNVFTIAVEADPSTPASELSGGGSSVGNWTSLIDYPMADDASGSIADAYALAYYPTIYLICPDRTVTEIGQGPASGGYWTPYTMYEEISGTCGVDMLPPFVIEGLNASVVSYDKDLVYCGESKVEPIITLQNLGTEAMTTCTINTVVDGGVISSFEWTGSLNSYSSEQITLAELPSGTTDVTFSVVMSGDLNSNDDDLSVSLSSAVSSHSYIHVQVNADFYPVETTWDIKDASGTVVMSGSYDGGTADDWNGGGPDADMTHDHFASLDNGCYTFTAYDAFGDGQTGYSGSGAGTDGSIVVTDGAGTELFNIAGGWGSEQSVAFEVNYGVGLEEAVENTISIFPNPASNYATIALNLTVSNEVVIEVINTLGQKVIVQSLGMNAGENTVKLPVETLTNGLYYVNIKIANEMITEKLNIIK